MRNSTTGYRDRDERQELGVYAFSAMAMRGSQGVHLVGTQVARDVRSASEAAMATCLECFPERRGYTGHSVQVMEV